MTTLLDVAEMLKDARKKAGLSQGELAQRAGVSRTTVARMETAAKGDMSVSALVRLLEAAGYDLKAVKLGHVGTVEDILAEQRQGDAPWGLTSKSAADSSRNSTASAMNTR